MNAGKVVIEDLRCELTEAERLRKGDELAQLSFTIAALEEEKAALSRALAERIKAKKTDAARIAADLQSGTELRPVECFERPRYRDLLVDVVRGDLDKVVRTRPMASSERQTTLEAHLRELEAGEPDDVEPDSDTTH